MHNVNLTHILPPAAVLIVVGIITTGIHGYHTERWNDLTDSEDLRVMAARLDDIPLSFGYWEGEIQKPDDDLLKQYEKAKVNGHTDILYTHSRTGKVVRVSLVCGHRRHVSIHTPNQCYVGAGFTMNGQERREVIDVPRFGKAETLACQFIKTDPVNSVNLQILWCWSADGDWIAPTSGRVGLRGETAWYKMYITTFLPGTTKSTNVDDNKEFMREYLPVLNAALFPAQEAKDHEEPAQLSAL